MGFSIVDGKGTGLSAGVDKTNRLEVNAVNQSVEHFINHIHGEAYNLIFSATPTGPGDCFLYVKNTDEKDMTLEGFWIWLVANEYIEIRLGDAGTPSGGAPITPVNLNAGSGHIASGIFQNGSDITGVTGGITTHKVYHASSEESHYHNFNQDIIIPKNRILTMYAETGTTPLSGMLVFNYHILSDDQ